MTQGKWKPTPFWADFLAIFVVVGFIAFLISLISGTSRLELFAIALIVTFVWTLIRQHRERKMHPYSWPDTDPTHEDLSLAAANLEKNEQEEKQRKQLQHEATVKQSDKHLNEVWEERRRRISEIAELERQLRDLKNIEGDVSEDNIL